MNPFHACGGILRRSFNTLISAAMFLALLVCAHALPTALGEDKPTDATRPSPNGGDVFGVVEASGLRWRHLSSRNGDLPAPGLSTQQTGAVVGDLDGDGVNDFVLSGSARSAAASRRRT